MLLQTVFIRDDKVILKDMDGSEIELIPGDALDLSRWIRAHLSEVTGAMRRFDEKARQFSDEKMNDDSQTTPES